MKYSFRQLNESLVIWAITIVASLSSCSSPSAMDTALQKAGKNRKEMERVLEYFSRTPEDSLKYKAAWFLIENMPGHTVCTDEKMISHFAYLKQQSNGSDWAEHLIAELIYLRFFDFSQHNSPTTEDIETLTSEQLIKHIESVFRQRESCPWLRETTFNDFCEYLLPPRLDKENTLLCRDSTLNEFQPIKDDIRLYDDMSISVSELSKELSALIQILSTKATSHLSEAKTQHKKDCLDEAMTGLMLHRLLGIPCALDMIPAWGNSNGNHTWAQPIERKFNYRKQIENFCREIPKVYRQTYSKQTEPLSARKEESIPNFFQNQYLKDVTDEYISVTQIKEQGFPKNVRYGYLCVFNQLKWKPVAQAIIESGICIFPKMGMNIAYLPAYFQNDELIPVASPFVLRNNGKKIRLINDNEKINIKLLRKYPIQKINVGNMKYISDWIVEASMTEDFQSSDTVGVIIKHSPTQPFDIQLKNYYRFFRISPRKKTYIRLAEIYFYNKKGERIIHKQTDNIHKAPPALPFSERNLSDNNILTYTLLNEKTSFSFQLTDSITSIRLLPASDGNGIYPDDEYELFYFDKAHEWVSCGKQKATTYHLNYQQVPKGALFWLRNLTTGKEERIFTYEEGKQKFW